MDQHQYSRTPALSGRSDSCKPGAAKSELWNIFQALVAGRAIIGIKSQPLATLRALVSLVQSESRLTIFASNKTLSRRAEGTPERTIRRHISKLIEVGLLRRVSSSNGKRFSTAHPDGPIEDFGLDLRPLLDRKAEIFAAAVNAERELTLVKFYRRKLGALIFACENIGADAATVDEIRPALRRKMTSADILRVCAHLEDLLTNASSEHPRAPTEELVAEPPYSDAEMAVDGGHFDRDIHSQKYIKKDSKARSIQPQSGESGPTVQLAEVIAQSPVAMSYLDEQPRTWWELEEASIRLAAWIGIQTGTVLTAMGTYGRTKIATILLSLFQRLETIRNPSAYFTSLVKQAQAVGSQVKWDRGPKRHSPVMASSP